MDLEKLEVVCILRRYKITCENIVMEIEVPEPLEGKDIESILEKDVPLKDFLSKCSIISYKHIMPENHKKGKDIHTEKLEKENAKKRKKLMLARGLSRRQRMVAMSKMEGEFTRLDYQKYIEDDFKTEMSDFRGHGDIEDAERGRIIEKTGNRAKNPATNHYMPTYRVVEKIPDEEYLVKKLKEGNKVIRESMT